MDTAYSLVILIIVLPLAGFLLNGLVGLSSPAYKRMKGFIGTVSNLAVFIPFALSLYLFFNLSSGADPIFVHLFNWIDVGSFAVDISYQIDQLSALMMLVVGWALYVNLYVSIQ